MAVEPANTDGVPPAADTAESGTIPIAPKRSRWRALLPLGWFVALAAAVVGLAWGVAWLSGYSLTEAWTWLKTHPVPYLHDAKTHPVFWSNAVVALLVLALVLPATRAARAIVHELLRAVRGLDSGIRYSLETIVGYVTAVWMLYLGITQVFSLEGLGYVLAALSVGIGFGMQEIVSNFVSGLILLVERPFKIGDTVRVGDVEGHVRKIKIRATTILTFDNVALLVPNKDFISQAVVNVRHTDPKVRCTIKVGVHYDSDVDLVRQTLLEVARGNPEVLHKPRAKAMFVNFGDNALEFELRVWVADPDHRLHVPSDLRFAIMAAFRERGIEIAYPQRDVHVRTWTPPPAGK